MTPTESHIRCVLNPILHNEIQTSPAVCDLKTDQLANTKSWRSDHACTANVVPQTECPASTISMICCVLTLVTSSQHPHGRLPAYACALNNSKPSKLPTTLCRIISVQSKQSAETALFAQKTAKNESKQLQMQARHGGRLSAKDQG